jgi:hypothetical protein
MVSKKNGTSWETPVHIQRENNRAGQVGGDGGRSGQWIAMVNVAVPAGKCECFFAVNRPAPVTNYRVLEKNGGFFIASSSRGSYACSIHLYKTLMIERGG